MAKNPKKIVIAPLKPRCTPVPPAKKLKDTKKEAARRACRKKVPEAENDV